MEICRFCWPKTALGPLWSLRDATLGIRDACIPRAWVLVRVLSRRRCSRSNSDIRCRFGVPFHRGREGYGDNGIKTRGFKDFGRSSEASSIMRWWMWAHTKLFVVETGLEGLVIADDVDRAIRADFRLQTKSPVHGVDR